MLEIQRPRKFDKIFLLFEKNNELINQFINDKRNCCLIGYKKLIDDHKLIGGNVFSFESIFGSSFFESKYQDIAANFFDHLCEDFRSGNNDLLKINGVSILDANSGNIMIYYLQKAFKYMDMAALLYNNFSADKVIISSLKEELSVAIYYESLERKINTAIISTMETWTGRFKAKMMDILWLINELSRSCLNVGRMEKVDDSHIMFFCKGQKYHDAIVPFVNALLIRESGNILIITKGDIPAEKQLRNERVQYINLYSFRNLRYGLTLLYQRSIIKRYWVQKIENQSSKFREWNNYNNPRYLMRIMNEWFRSDINRAMRAALLSVAVFDKLLPRIIVVLDYADFEAKTLTLMGKERGIISFCSKFGAASKYSSELRYFKQDYLGVMGLEDVALMKEHGIRKEQIVITGCPRFDSYKLDNNLARSVRHDLNIPITAKMIAFMSIPPVVDGIGKREAGLSLEEYKFLLSIIYNIPSLSTEFILVIKPHPEEYEHAYLHKEYANANLILADRIKLVQNKSAYDIINAADLVITMQSTTGLEAILLNKPLIVVNMTGRTDTANYATSGAAYPVRKKEDLPIAIKDLLYDEEVSAHYDKMRRQYLRQNLSYVHESAARTADVVMQLSNKGAGRELMGAAR